MFSIRAFDKFGNAIKSGGHHFDVHIVGSSSASCSYLNTMRKRTEDTVSSKKAALQNALKQASNLENEVEMLSEAHAAVLSGNAATGEVSDFGNGRYSVRFDPREVPVAETPSQQSFLVLVVDAESGEHISGSPFVVPYVKSQCLASQCDLSIDHIDEVVAGERGRAGVRS